MKAINPANGAVINEYDEHSEEEVNERLDIAVNRFEEWRSTPIEHRTDLVLKVADLLEQRKQSLSKLMTEEMGKPISQARAEVEKCAWVCRYYSDHAPNFLKPRPVQTDAKQSMVVYEPLGVLFAIMPWNFPFWQAFRAAIPALTTGNTFVLKHASNVPGSALAMEKLFLDAGAPRGVFTTLLIGGKRATPVIQDDRIAAITVTGSTGVGRSIAKHAGECLKPSVLELGGSDPFIVLADADIDAAVDMAVKARFQNNGQSCIAAKRWIIEAPVYDLFVRKAGEKVKELTCDDPIFESTDVGPLAREDLRDDLEEQVRGTVGRGARCVAGGERVSGKGYFFQPTLLAEVEPGMPCFDDETFGPVAAATIAQDADEAIQLANKTPFGLGSAIWTKASRAPEFVSRIRAGHVAVNGMTKSDPRLPFGGIKDSGFGRELSSEGQYAFANIKTVWIGE